MARLSDLIEMFIKDLLDETEESELQIQRNELANQFSCAPSQINYVLTTRFTRDKGYYIESRRGGGGYIIIKKSEVNNCKNISELINDKIGNSITYDGALAIINGLFDSGLLTEREANLMKFIANDRTLKDANNRNAIRADILKSMVMFIFI